MLPAVAVAASPPPTSLDLTDHPVGAAALAVFVLAYLLVIFEEFTSLRKSKPVILAAGLIWAMVAWVYADRGLAGLATIAARETFLDFSELMIFLLVAMTYINTMEERRVFDALRAWLVRRQFGFRTLFWITGGLAFLISPVADNLTTALIMSAVVMACGQGNTRFVSIACVNIVVAANAGGTFTPFGDITTLMVWQSGKVGFWTFFNLFLPALVNFLVPAVIMQFAVPRVTPEKTTSIVRMKLGARRVIVLFALTIATAITFNNFLKLPPVLGMMTGLGYLQILGYYLRMRAVRSERSQNAETMIEQAMPFDVFNKVARAKWDTLLFFYGVVLCVGGLGFIGYLAQVSELVYEHWGATTANISVGVLSAIIDNIPVMFSVLSMDPAMPQGQWLLVTLTAGVGGSLLSVGSAAGVALMGQAHGQYTFFSHLRWTPAIAAGYASSVLLHLWIDTALS